MIAWSPQRLLEPVHLVLLVVVVIGAAFDVAARIVPNWLTLPALGFGLAWSWRSGGRKGLADAAAAAGLLLVLGFFPMAAWPRAFGPGDWKLLAAVGAFLGLRRGLWAGLLSALLIGNLLVNIAASVVATSVCVGWFGPTGLAVAVPAMTVLLLLVGEITPKMLALRFRRRLAVLTQAPLAPSEAPVRMPATTPRPNSRRWPANRPRAPGKRRPFR